MQFFIYFVIFFTVAAVGLGMHNRVMEGVNARFRKLQRQIETLSKENDRLQGRLNSCNQTVDTLQRQLSECEQQKRELIMKDKM